MSKIPTPAWEPWQLTAYLLGELEADVSERIASAAREDAELARQLNELEATINAVKATLASECPEPAQRQTLTTIGQNLMQSAPAASPVPRRSFRSVAGRLSARWENWLSLAGLILIALILARRNGPASDPVAIAPSTNATGAATEQASSGSASSSVTADPTELSIAMESGVRREHEFMESRPDVTTPDTFSTADLSTTMSAKPSSSGLASAAAAPSGAAAPVNELSKDSSTAMLGGLNYSYGDQVAGDVGRGANQASIDRRLSLAAPTPTSPAAADASTLLAQGESKFSLAPGQPSNGSSGLAGRSLSRDTGGAAGVSGGMGGMYGMGGMAGGGGGYGGSPDGYADGLGIHPGAPYGTAAGGFGGGIVDERLGRSSEYRSAAPGGDRFASFNDNPFDSVSDHPLSTFSIDVDTASFSKARQYLLEAHQLPPAAAVRLEEFINSFEYEYDGPRDQTPFAATMSAATCPWQPRHQLVRIALQAKKVDVQERPQANLVFLLDVSGSMNEPNKLPLVKETMRLLTYQLTEKDRVAMVVYAGAAGCVLDSTYGHQQDAILQAIERLSAGGSTNGGQGIQLAYKIARDHFVPGGINRVILCTDGDFNVGVTTTDDLVRLVEEQARSNVFLTVLGYGIGNTNDAMMEQIADKGNGIYGFVDSRREAQRQMVQQLAGNLITIAKDVKIQVEFNPAKVRAYRLLGYENRQLAAEDFNNDRKDAGEIGAGHCVTALYEIVPTSSPAGTTAAVDPLRYQAPRSEPMPVAAALVDDKNVAGELLAVKLRYKQPEGTESQLLTFPLEDRSVAYEQADADFRWAAAMAEFGMLLRNSPHKGTSNWSALSQRARGAAGTPLDPARAEALEMISQAQRLQGN